jgi:putative transposase
VSAYKLIDAEKASFPVAVLCKVLSVSRSGYYAWRDRPPSRRSRQDAALTAKIYEIHRRSRETYGSPRIHAELRSIGGVRCGCRKRVARLMRKEGLEGLHPRPKKAYYPPGQACPPRRGSGSPGLRSSWARGRLWTADITYVSTDEGFLYLAFILDAYSRRLVVGWAMESHLRTELVVDALQMAVWRRKPAPGLIHHSDQGVQYTPLSFAKRLEQVGIIPSMGQVGSALDNAISESFVATLKSELVSRVVFPNRQAAKTAIFEYLEAFYNTRRLHSSLGYRSPADFEEDTMREANVA